MRPASSGRGFRRRGRADDPRVPPARVSASARPIGEAAGARSCLQARADASGGEGGDDPGRCLPRQRRRATHRGCGRRPVLPASSGRGLRAARAAITRGCRLPRHRPRATHQGGSRRPVLPASSGRAGGGEGGDDPRGPSAPAALSGYPIEGGRRRPVLPRCSGRGLERRGRADDVRARSVPAARPPQGRRRVADAPGRVGRGLRAARGAVEWRAPQPLQGHSSCRRAP